MMSAQTECALRRRCRTSAGARLSVTAKVKANVLFFDRGRSEGRLDEDGNRISTFAPTAASP